MRARAHTHIHTYTHIHARIHTNQIRALLEGIAHSICDIIIAARRRDIKKLIKVEIERER